MNITSNNTMIFVKEDDNLKKHYRAGLSTKKQDGTYDKAYIDVKMPKGTNIDDRTKINITKGFLSFYNYTSKDDKQHTIWYVVVQEYTKQKETKDDEVYVVQSVKDEELELPF